MISGSSNQVRKGHLDFQYNTQTDEPRWNFTLGSSATNQEDVFTIGTDQAIFNTSDIDIIRSTEDDSQGPDINLYHDHTENGESRPGADNSITAGLIYSANFVDDQYSITDAASNYQPLYEPDTTHSSTNYFYLLDGQVLGGDNGFVISGANAATIDDSDVIHDTFWTIGETKQIAAVGTDQDGIFGSGRAVGDTLYILLGIDNSNYMYVEANIINVGSATEYAVAEYNDANIIVNDGEISGGSGLWAVSQSSDIYDDDQDGLSITYQANKHMASILGETFSVRQGNANGYNTGLTFHTLINETDVDADPQQIAEFRGSRISLDANTTVQQRSGGSDFSIFNVRNESNTNLLDIDEDWITVERPFELYNISTSSRNNLTVSATEAGSLIWNTSDDTVQVYNGTTWVDVGSSISVTKAAVDTAIGASASGDATMFYNEQGDFVSASATVDETATYDWTGVHSFENDVTLGDNSGDTITINGASAFATTAQFGSTTSGTNNTIYGALAIETASGGVQTGDLSIDGSFTLNGDIEQDRGDSEIFNVRQTEFAAGSYSTGSDADQEITNQVFTEEQNHNLLDNDPTPAVVNRTFGGHYGFMQIDDDHTHMWTSTEVYQRPRAFANTNHFSAKTSLRQDEDKFRFVYNTDNDSSFDWDADRLVEIGSDDVKIYNDGTQQANFKKGDNWQLTFSEIIIAGVATDNSGQTSGTTDTTARDYDEYLYLDGIRYYRVYADDTDLTDNSDTNPWFFQTVGGTDYYYSEQIWSEIDNDDRTIIANRL